MRIAFVGIEKDWKDLEKRDYVDKFIQYHLELPYYYARDGGNLVRIVTDYHTKWKPFESGGAICCTNYETFKQIDDVDVVIHWRKWFEDCYKPKAINVINSQDHSYSAQWLTQVNEATQKQKLHGILCFPTWHLKNIKNEFQKIWHMPDLFSGVTLGVDTEIYKPHPDKSPFDLLWASDPGRGFIGAIELAMKLFQKDKRFKLHICWPDYVKKSPLLITKHPAIEVHENLNNGPELWNLFNKCGFLPYTSTFKEPSSRVHRQAMAAGCIVLYPPDMGTPSYLIDSGVTGFVRPVDEWADIITRVANNEEEFNWISKKARDYAVSENWEVQAKRFNKLFEGMLKNG